MISFENAKTIALSHKTDRVLFACNELTDSWVFTFSYSDGKECFDSPIRVYKETGESKQWDFVNPKNWDEMKKKFKQKIDL